jgi:putative transposase
VSSTSAPAYEPPSYRGYRYPAEIISHAVWLYFRFSLSLRDVEELLAERGVTVSYETIREWCAKFGPAYALELRRRRRRPSDKWHLDEVQLKIKGKRHWLWRAVDKHGVVLDILVQERRDQVAAETFLRRVLEAAGSQPRVVITDKLRSYLSALRRVLPDVDHRQHKGLNNRAENSHQPTRQRERLMRRFKSAEQRVLMFMTTSRCKSGQGRYQGTFVAARRRSGRPGCRSAGSNPPREGATHRSVA